MAADDLTPHPFGLSIGLGHSSPDSTGRLHQHDEVEVGYLQKGALTYQFAEAEVTLRGNSWTVFWAGFPHKIMNGSLAQGFYWLTVPLELVLQWRLPEPFLRALMSGQVLTIPEPGRRTLDQALWHSWYQDLQPGTGASTRWTLLEIESRLGRLAEATASIPSESPRPQTVALPGARAGSVARFAACLSQHYAEPFAWKDAAKEAGLSAEMARRRFCECYGMTLHQYLVSLRLARAKQLLATADLKVIDVALASGFATLSNFYRAFEAMVGQTPSAYRRACRSRS